MRFILVLKDQNIKNAGSDRNSFKEFDENTKKNEVQFENIH